MEVGVERDLRGRGLPSWLISSILIGYIGFLVLDSSPCLLHQHDYHAWNILLSRPCPIAHSKRLAAGRRHAVCRSHEHQHS
ncbi:hypothetical protein N656DRAFT_150259 [Canariomyces notabilis]|uniref:Uncharacterized protein n=1 Tax=Canariomyces notabilis TaxID=2074819 RepID=A0AAN6YQN7_9PEZI|nr:hypothetical protein N656DRAFT_150259 [Canariomyces arenarius]